MQRILRCNRLVTYSWEGDSKGTPGKAQELQAQEAQNKLRPLTQSIMGLRGTLLVNMSWRCQCKLNGREAGLADYPELMVPCSLPLLSLAGPGQQASLAFITMGTVRAPCYSVMFEFRNFQKSSASKINPWQRLAESQQNLGKLLLTSISSLMLSMSFAVVSPLVA